MPLKHKSSEGLTLRLLRIGGVVLLLVGPLIFFLSLRITGKNHYELPVYFESPGSKKSGLSLGGVHCLPLTYPYDVFAHPSGEQFAKEGVHTYLLHNIERETNLEALHLFYEKVREKGPLQMYGLLREDEATSAPPSTRPDWQFISYSKQGLHYIRDCLLLVDKLFEERVPTSWAVLLDSRGRIRGFFNPNDQSDLRKGLAEGYILQDLSKRSLQDVAKKSP